MKFIKPNIDILKELRILAYNSEKYWGYDEEFMNVFDSEFNITKDFIEKYPVFVGFDADEPIGFWGAILSEDQCELEYFYVDQSKLGLGYGKEMWQNFIKWCKEQGIKIVTFVTSPQAVGFYKKMGAKVVGETTSIIDGRTIPQLSYRIEGTVMVETSRLRLREYTTEDYEALYNIISDPITMQHYPRPYDETGTRRWLEWSIGNYEERGFGWWAVTSKETGELMGDCGITLQIINGEILPEIGYHFDKKFWRKGFGTEAAKAVRDWAFINTDYTQLYSYMTQKNIGSYSVAEAIGMERVEVYTDEKYGEMFVYAITREAWERIREE